MMDTLVTRVTDLFYPSWISQTRFFALVTQAPQTPLFPPHIILPLPVHAGLFNVCATGLITLLVSPYPRSTRGKQAVALPFFVAMVLQPVVFMSSGLRILSMPVILAASAFSMRFLDLFFLRPWVGTSRPLVGERGVGGGGGGRQGKKRLDGVARAKKDLDVDVVALKEAQAQERRDGLMWTMEELRVELWSPLRIIPSTYSSSTFRSGKPKRVMPAIYLIPQILWYLSLEFITTYPILHYTVQDVRDSPPAYALAVISCAITFMSPRQLAQIGALLWTLWTGLPIDLDEWPMLNQPYPYFATSPADFWTKWHSFFKTVWMDLGFYPTKRFVKWSIRPEYVGSTVALAAQLILPPMSVFVLSGVMHGYCVYAMSRESPYSQLAYFLLQGFAVIVSKAIERTALGQRVQQWREGGGWVTYCVYQILGMWMMACFHFMTVPLMMYPYMKQALWEDVRLLRPLVYFPFENKTLA